MAVLILTSLGLAITLSGSLEVIAPFSSMTFLLVSLLVSTANLRLHRETGARVSVVLIGIALMAATVVLLCVYLAMNEPSTLWVIALLYVITVGVERVHSAWAQRHSSSH